MSRPRPTIPYPRVRLQGPEEGDIFDQNRKVSSVFPDTFCFAEVLFDPILKSKSVFPESFLPDYELVITRL